MQGNALIDVRVRQQVGDSVADYRYDTPLMLVYVNDGLREIWRQHAEAFYGSSVIVEYPGDLSSLTEELPIGDNFINALMHFVCHRIHLQNAEDANNREKSAMHYDLFMRAMA